LSCVVGSPAVWLVLITIGTSPEMVSRGFEGMVPSAFAGQPSRTRPESVFRTPSASVRKLPVRVMRRGVSLSALPSDTSLITGSMPRPAIARSSGLPVPTRSPRSSIRRTVEARTPPAE